VIRRFASTTALFLALHAGAACASITDVADAPAAKSGELRRPEMSVEGPKSLLMKCENCQRDGSDEKWAWLISGLALVTVLAASRRASV
jgi:hypothetical protein